MVCIISKLKYDTEKMKKVCTFYKKETHAYQAPLPRKV